MWTSGNMRRCANRERVPTEEYQVGERIRCYVKAVVQQGPHGPEIILSRADNKFVIKLCKVEVSDNSDGTIEIKGIARVTGFRTKWPSGPGTIRWIRWALASGSAGRE